MISLSEQEYVQEGVEFGFRSDGRKLADLRTLFVENKVLPHVNGTAHLRLGYGTTILCSIKCEITEPLSDLPGQGILEVDVDISAGCLPDRVNNHRRSDIASGYAELLRNVYVGSGCIDLDALCIIPGKYCWMIHIDVVAFELDCNLVDAASYAIYAALDCTRLPQIQLKPGERGELQDFDVCGDLAKAVPLPLRDVPILFTIHLIRGFQVLDCSVEEIRCASGAISVAVDSKGICRGLHKEQVGTILLSDIKGAIVSATEAAKDRFPTLLKLTEESEVAAFDDMFADVPASRIGLLL
jgi:exosome complex RNA-binding protein Rrp42 (RNase PH superfamily)